MKIKALFGSALLLTLASSSVFAQYDQTINRHSSLRVGSAGQQVIITVNAVHLEPKPSLQQGVRSLDNTDYEPLIRVAYYDSLDAKAQPCFQTGAPKNISPDVLPSGVAHSDFFSVTTNNYCTAGIVKVVYTPLNLDGSPSTAFKGSTVTVTPAFSDKVHNQWVVILKEGTHPTFDPSSGKLVTAGTIQETTSALIGPPSASI